MTIPLPISNLRPSMDVFGTYNLGAQTLTMKLPISQFIELSEVSNERAKPTDEVAQRPLDPNHARNLAIYILKGLIHAAMDLRRTSDQGVPQIFKDMLRTLGDQAYYSLQPFVCNVSCKLEDCDPIPQKNAVGDTLTVRISPPPHATLLWVIDGQHRRSGMSLVLEFLQHVRSHNQYPRRKSLYPYNGNGVDLSREELEVWRDCNSIAMRYCTVSLEAHFDMTVEQQRQLFHDLNNLGKRVEAGRAFNYDNSNPVNLFVKNEMIEGGLLKAPIVEKDITDWAKHNGSIARKDVVAVNAILFLNKTSVRGATPPKVESMKETAREFWMRIGGIAGFGKPGAKLKTVAAQPVVLKALAKLTYDFAMGKHENPDNLKNLLKAIPDIDFSHDNPMWLYYTMDDEERARKCPGLINFLPHDDDAVNRDIGAPDSEGRMRFGAKHNDIYPILGDMIRWSLKLPTRHPKKEDQNDD